MAPISNHPMTPSDFIDRIEELYKNARSSAFKHERVSRGRSHSISGMLEDLMAAYLATHDLYGRKFFVDQPIRMMLPDGEGPKKLKTKYPDIVVQNTNGVIENLIDLKADLGWMRNELFDFALKMDGQIEEIKDSQTSFKRGEDKVLLEGHFSPNLKHHIIIVTMKNSNKKAELDFQRVQGELPNVEIYCLSDGVHPNVYDSHKQTEKHGNTTAKECEFEALVRNICHDLDAP